MDLIENSSDLEMGRRPELKSDEFLIRSILCNEIMSILVEIARRLCHHLLGFEVPEMFAYVPCSMLCVA